MAFVHFFWSDHYFFVCSGFRALLILDDIWDNTVLKVFDVQSRILLTTRNRSVTDSVSGTHCFFSLFSLIVFRLEHTVFIFMCSGKYCAFILKVLSMRLNWRAAWMITKGWRSSLCTLTSKPARFLRRLAA